MSDEAGDNGSGEGSLDASFNRSTTLFNLLLKWFQYRFDIHRGRTAILREKKAKKSIKSSKKTTFLTQILNINEYFSNDYCEFS